MSAARPSGGSVCVCVAGERAAQERTSRTSATSGEQRLHARDGVGARLEVGAEPDERSHGGHGNRGKQRIEGEAVGSSRVGVGCDRGEHGRECATSHWPPRFAHDPDGPSMLLAS